MKFKSYSQQIDYILKNFDFERIWNIMLLTNWTWADKNNKHYIPSMKQLKEVAKRLLNEVVKTKKENYWKISTGGFEATKYNKCLSLQFVITDEYGYSDLD
jgi:hypothetical protein